MHGARVLSPHRPQLVAELHGHLLPNTPATATHLPQLVLVRALLVQQLSPLALGLLASQTVPEICRLLRHGQQVCGGGHARRGQAPTGEHVLVDGHAHGVQPSAYHRPLGEQGLLSLKAQLRLLPPILALLVPVVAAQRPLQLLRRHRDAVIGLLEKVHALLAPSRRAHGQGRNELEVFLLSFLLVRLSQLLGGFSLVVRSDTLLGIQAVVAAVAGVALGPGGLG
mmetsp:Transcript_64312/g.182399  ORF Transcript_64312/g.182399 Transcript_64312/m.182399 type:complete len:225 (-) Transcript_64312:797-1471(-)